MSRSRQANYPNQALNYSTQIIPEQYYITDWTHEYIPTERNIGRRRPVIYVAAPMPAMPMMSPMGGMPFGSPFGAMSPMGNMPFGSPFAATPRARQRGRYF